MRLLGFPQWHLHGARCYSDGFASDLHRIPFSPKRALTPRGICNFYSNLVRLYYTPPTCRRQLSFHTHRMRFHERLTPTGAKNLNCRISNLSTAGCVASAAFSLTVIHSSAVKRSHADEPEVLLLHPFSLFLQPSHTFVSGFWVFLEWSAGSLHISPTAPDTCAAHTVPRKFASIQSLLFEFLAPGRKQAGLWDHKWCLAVSLLLFPPTPAVLPSADYKV